MFDYIYIHAMNAEEYVGKKVRVNYGAMYGSLKGLITGVGFDNIGCHLIMNMADGEIKTTSVLEDPNFPHTIGVHLI